MAAIKYNNPGNIRIGENWLGSITPGASSSFVEFKTLAYGIRAIFVILNTKIGKGQNTIEKIITTYAPPTENDTETYIQNVSQWTGIPRTATIFSDNYPDLKKIVKAIVRQEQGVILTDSEIEEGFNLWQNIKKKGLT